MYIDWIIAALFFAFTRSSNAQQKDPLKDFCRIHGHATTIVDRELFVDGGYVNWSPITKDTTNDTSKYPESHVDCKTYPDNSR